MRQAVGFNRSSSGYKRLSSYLPAKSADVRLIGGQTNKFGFTKAFKVEQKHNLNYRLNWTHHMANLVDAVRAQIQNPGRRKFIKYSFVSVISVAITEIALIILHAGVKLSPGWSSFWASTIAAFPSYYLNRNWVWAKSGRSHMRKEVLPFWILAFIGIGFSALIGKIVGGATDGIENHNLQTLVLVTANVGAFGVLWILKFIIFNKILFAHKPEVLEDEPALDGRSGIPG